MEEGSGLLTGRSYGVFLVFAGPTLLACGACPTPMSDSIGHECGIALIRLLRPLSYYHQHYGSPYYG
ncbi:MAG: hypothetical protein FJ336_02910, partial [Sphingomonadales bacterium]|nr:hypothetical protein [Sphingomonadales bacterium]